MSLSCSFSRYVWDYCENADCHLGVILDTLVGYFARASVFKLLVVQSFGDVSVSLFDANCHLCCVFEQRGVFAIAKELPLFEVMHG